MWSEPSSSFVGVQPSRTQPNLTFDFLLYLASASAVPPSAILILDQEKNMLKNGTVLGPLREGQTLNMECEVRGARPPPTVGWYRSGKRLTGEHS